MKFLFTCGGTAGHINPALAVAERIKEMMPESEFLFVGTEKNIEKDLVPMAGYDFTTVTISNLHRSLAPAEIVHNLKTLRNLMVSPAQAKRILKSFKPDIVIGTGGYVCYPVVKMAHKLKIPTVIHESNAVPGLTTKMLMSKCDRILVGFEESKSFYSNPEKVFVTGTPVRTDFLKYSHVSAKSELGIPQNIPLVVSFWGSLGAEHMNEIMAEFISLKNRENDFYLIYAVGSRGMNAMNEHLAGLNTKLSDLADTEIRPYIYDMARVMVAADLIICRAGASTLSELTFLGKPAILVPSPYVTNNHQEKNARVLEKAGGAKMLLESELNGEKLLTETEKLLKDPNAMAKMSEASKKLGITDAVDKIVEIILGLLKG